MIVSDQPTCFPDSVLAVVSSKADGTMLDRDKDAIHGLEIVRNRQNWCERNGLAYDSVVYQEIVYDDQQTYVSVAEVTARDSTRYVLGKKGDALFTKEAGVGLFLPVADCVATVVYDSKKKYLALLHLGRHSTYAGLVEEAVSVFMRKGSDPQDVTVWMSPSAQKASYRLEWFEYEHDTRWQGFFEKKAEGYYLDMQGYNAQRFVDMGVPIQQIHISEVDTMQDAHYFSHSQGDTGGRIAVLAQMR